MAELGLTSMLIGLVLSGYSVLASLLGAIKGRSEVIDSAKYATYLVMMALMISMLCLIASFLDHDFSLKYVEAHSSLATPRVYTWVAIYAGNEGSLLFIATVLSVISAIAVRFSPMKFRISLPYTNAVLMLIMVFFLSVMAFLANPFARLDTIPFDGQGINPLLLHPGMFAHPPILMTGLVLVSVPFAFALGALISNRVEDDWVDVARVWGILAWAVLGTGLLLGAWWAYTILGWGGYWAWDPVENSGLMPWLGLTAFIHSIMVQKRQGMFRMWNLALINITFGLSLFGMFINRGGPVPSVHSFASSTLGWVFLTFMIVGVVVPFVIFFWRFNKLRSTRSLESSFSREGAFLANNLLLLAIAFITLWGVVYPLISELFTGFTITVGQQFYNQVNGPLMLALVFLMGVGPMLPWRQASWGNLRKNLLVPLFLALLVIVTLIIFQIQNPFALIAFGLFAMVATGIAMEWIRGTRSRHRRGNGVVQSFMTLIASNRPRYGGYVVHLAVVVLGMGIVGSSFFNVQKDILLEPGEEVVVRGYRIQYSGFTTIPRPDRTESYYMINVFKGSEVLTTLEAERTYYPDFNMYATRAGIRSTPVEDLYIVPSESREGQTSVGFRIFINPMVWWIWIAGPIMLIGTVIVLWPENLNWFDRSNTSLKP
ncbi:heme lyase CcmF/NrfE family subunit [SAR202 cluster bacterium AD-804-J14_MRT_500m]|nr:heme lyase CcmF/NrfE family subunit [SAR202 cluster bacterium AD-804-J14_MRT_500m]